jgi:hypothetical protein
MKLEEALNLVKQACADFKGNLNDHQTIQKALSVIEAATKPKKKK